MINSTIKEEQTAAQPEEDNKQKLSDAVEIRYLTEANCTFTQTDGGMLEVRVDDVPNSPIYLHSSFPHTNRGSYVSVRTPDNNEIGMIKSLNDFAEPTRTLLEEHLNLRYFAPEIVRVIDVREEFGYAYWEAETTSGICRFAVRVGGGNAKLVTANRLLITDVDGNRFIVTDIERLSDKEYRMVEISM